VVLGLQIAVEIGDMLSAPCKGHRQDQQAKIRTMVPLQVPVQRTKDLVKRRGHTYDAKQEAMLPEPRVNGRLHTLPNHGPRMASPAAVKTFPQVPL
jgi:hypothetical protein